MPEWIARLPDCSNVGCVKARSAVPRLSAIQPRGLRCAQPTLQFVTTGLDPVVHVDLFGRMDCRIKHALGAA